MKTQSIALLLLAAALPANVAAKAETIEAAPVALEGTEVRSLRSAQGLDYRIFISTPTEQAPPGGWPVVYVLDGNGWFLPFAQLARMVGRRPGHNGRLPAVVVGIGYPGERPFHSERRTWDFTPPVALREPPPAPGGKPWSRTGGSEDFLDFLKTRVKPMIEAEFRIDTGRQALYGHSLGGLFALHAAFTRPASFQYFGAMSPSIWWNKNYVTDEEKAFPAVLAKHKGRVNLFIGVGASELPHMVGDADAMAKRIAAAKYDGLDFTYVAFPGEEHISVAAPAFTRFYDAVFAATEADKASYLKVYDLGQDATALEDADAYFRLTPQRQAAVRRAGRNLANADPTAFDRRLRGWIAALPAHERGAVQKQHDLWDRRTGTVPVPY